jgi:dimethylamine monooxygenase subunit B
MNNTTIPVMINAITEETPQIKRFTLIAVEGYTLPRFSGGSHITTIIDNIIRPYSLINHPDQNENYQIAIRLSDDSKGGSRHWHHQVKVGDKLRISYPKNHFPLSFTAKHHVFYAAGIGITPFLSMMSELQADGASFELHYAAKSENLCAFKDYLKTNYPDQVHFYFSNERNRLEPSSLLTHRIGTHVYFCGPESFITSFTEAAIHYGYPKKSVHFERFKAIQPIEPLPFIVKLKDGLELQVGRNQTLLEALLEKGYQVPYSCRAGRCGSCEVRVLDGKVAHFDEFLSEEQKSSSYSILTCVSRAQSEKLAIDV